MEPVYWSPVSSMRLSGSTGLARLAETTPGTTLNRRFLKTPSLSVRGWYSKRKPTDWLRVRWRCRPAFRLEVVALMPTEARGPRIG